MSLLKLCQINERLECLFEKGLVVTKLPLYETQEVWAEESGGLNANTSEWSYGNGSTGFIGLPVDAGWEITAMAFHADQFVANTNVTIDTMDYSVVASDATTNTLSSININTSTDGGGITDNTYKWFDLPSPVPIPVNGQGAGLVGFITRGLTGASTDSRILYRRRRLIGEYVSDVALPTACDLELGDFTFNPTNRTNAGWNNEPLIDATIFDD